MQTVIIKEEGGALLINEKYKGRVVCIETKRASTL